MDYFSFPMRVRQSEVVSLIWSTNSALKAVMGKQLRVINGIPESRFTWIWNPEGMVLRQSWYYDILCDGLLVTSDVGCIIIAAIPK